MDIETLNDSLLALALTILRASGHDLDVRTVADSFGNSVREVLAYRQYLDIQKGQSQQ